MPMLDTVSLPRNWFNLLLFSFALVLVLNSLLACTISRYYLNKPVGRLSHSQLRVKQGNASFEQRLNVFGHTLVLGIFKPGLYAIALLVWVGLVLCGSFGIISL